MKSIVGVTLFSVLASSAFASAPETCKLTAPPRQAISISNHGMFYFVYPRVLEPTFSGCQTIWDEKGRPWFVSTFKHGTLIRYESRDWSKHGRKELCKYMSGRLTKNSPQKCPDYEDVKGGVHRHIPPEDEIITVVPPERDPRK
jgi:hypothetical protein